MKGASKRDVDEVDDTGTVQKSVGGKRRRVLPHSDEEQKRKDKEQTTQNDGVIPMEIEKTEEPIPSSSTQDAVNNIVLQLSQAKTVKETKAVSIGKTPYVPKAPPTARQVTERLLTKKLQRISIDGEKASQLNIKAPPPSPFTPNRVPTPNTSSSITSNKVCKPTSKGNNHIKKDKITVKAIIPLEKNPSLLISHVFYRLLRVAALIASAVICVKYVSWRGSFHNNPVNRLYPHIVPPDFVTEETACSRDDLLTNFTLRDFLLDPQGFHLAMAPAFFGFYVYFGVLEAWDEEFSTDDFHFLTENVKSVSGGSAGAMAAVMLSSGIQPRRAAEKCNNITLTDFADPPGIGAIFQGILFEKIMQEFLEQEGGALQLEDGIVPIAVSGFDLKALKGRILTRGNMARAARASATFPLLFQPVSWQEGNETYMLIDGGVTDGLGLQGLSELTCGKAERIVNIVAGSEFPGVGPLSPSDMPDGISAKEVLYISIRGTPTCGPLHLQNGPRALEGALRSMKASLDLPLYKGDEDGHYELHIDALEFVLAT